MTPYKTTKLILYMYLKFFLGFGVPFGLIIGLWDGYNGGLSVGLANGLTVGIFYGGIMSITVGSWHLYCVRRISPKNYPEELIVNHKRVTELQLPYDKTFDTCIKSLGEIKKCTVKKKDHSLGEISAKIGAGWSCFGEIITFKVIRGDSNHTRVEVTSKPVIWVTLADFGKDLKNVLTIDSFLKEHNFIS